MNTSSSRVWVFLLGRRKLLLGLSALIVVIALSALMAFCYLTCIIFLQ